MKPEMLKIQAFGTFAGYEEIDFRKLGERSLFLIHGPTGSGKTTILDALCFALYGETSGRDRAAYQMRSDFSNATLQTEVTLYFSIDTRHFRVTRIPEQDKAKVRGGGTTRKPASAVLYAVTGTESEHEEQVIADRWSRVTEKIEELIGFRCDQFRQVVVIPQGDFRRLLSANSQERQEILTILFKTGRFKLYEDALKEAVKAIRNQHELLKSQLQFCYRETSAESAEQLHVAIETGNAEIAVAKKNMDEQRAKEAELLEKLKKIRETQSLFNECDAAVRDYNEIESKRANFDELASNLKKYERAHQLKNEWDSVNYLESDLRLIQEKRTTAKTELDTADKTKSALEEKLKSVHNMNRKRESILSEIQRLELAVPKICQLEKSKNALISLKSSVDTLATNRISKKEYLDKVKIALKRLQNEIEVLNEKSLMVDLRKKEVAVLDTTIDVVGKILKTEKEMELVSDVVRSKKSELEKITDILLKNRGLLEERENAARANTIGVLSRGLVPGQACPVCGSCDHPSPALADESTPQFSEIERLKQTIVLDEKKREAKREELDKSLLRLNNLQKECEMLRKSAGEVEISEEGIRILQKQAQETRASVEESVRAQERLEKLKNDRNRGDEALVATEKELEKISEDISQLSASLQSEETLVKSIESETDKEIRNAASLQDIIKRKEIEIRIIDEELDKLKSEYDAVVKQQISLSSAFKHLTENESELTAKFQKMQRELDEKITGNGFNSTAEFQTALVSDETINQTKDKVNRYSLSLHAAEERKLRAERNCEHLTRVDSEGIENGYKQIQNEIEISTKKITELHHSKELMEKKLEEISSLEKQIVQLDKKYGVIGSLSEVASGDNPQRMTFERFVLASLLDEVLVTGSQRLKIMSSGRFEMHRALKNEDMRAAGGLDIQVYDSYTGTSRPVSTLSGGESFLAALSMALGLSDVVQSYSGGIRIETIFIDEGFGSLDAEALDQAFQALMSIGQDGRVVGIISHVTELRERIDTRLEVIATKNGSTTKFRI